MYTSGSLRKRRSNSVVVKYKPTSSAKHNGKKTNHRPLPKNDEKSSKSTRSWLKVHRKRKSNVSKTESDETHSPKQSIFTDDDTVYVAILCYDDNSAAESSASIGEKTPESDQSALTGSYSCSTCRKDFDCELNLKKHPCLRYACSLCSKRFFAKRNLQEHMLTHSTRKARGRHKAQKTTVLKTP